jgi:hypothetical protein
MRAIAARASRELVALWKACAAPACGSKVASTPADRAAVARRTASS